ncbi:hypothetical protein KOI35_20970 [Actinoplanes bogorensis]|uniref:Lipoprotein n=1 Tax=Paractinoplanes bogorensis TaxID=1610840 RepID=A0ABS5YTD9_9ACTN|nr:hypothetical protein [Actinoplanes bogorensis]MBU2665988.1 hypothetical protein [Actinoplanes bogorensis]
MRMRMIAGTALAGLMALTAGCSSTDSSQDLSGDTGMTVQDLHLSVSLDVSGAVTAKGTSNAPMATNNGVDYESCDEYGAGESNTDGVKYLVLPQMPIDNIGGRQVFIGAMIKNYHGAGTYEKATLTDTGSPPGISFAGTLYFTQSNTTSQITADGKGGGTWTFTDLSVQNADGTHGGGGDAVSGSVTWECKE